MAFTAYNIADEDEDDMIKFFIVENNSTVIMDESGLDEDPVFLIQSTEEEEVRIKSFEGIFPTWPALLGHMQQLVREVVL